MLYIQYISMQCRLIFCKFHTDWINAWFHKRGKTLLWKLNYFWLQIAMDTYGIFSLFVSQKYQIMESTSSLVLEKLTQN